MMRTHMTQFSAQAMRWLRAFAQLGWPNKLAGVLLLTAALFTVSAWAIFRHAQEMSLRFGPLQTQQAAVQPGAPPVYEPLSMAPPDTQYIRDLGLLFQWGKEAGVTFGIIEYKSEVHPKTPLTVRTLDLRTQEDYPKIKGFISRVLNDMPHAALQEIRIDRKDAQAIQGAMLIQLSLVYQTPLPHAR